MVPARLRVDDGWADATILNLSNRGLMLRAPVTLARGHVIELRRGTHVLVARVMWSDGHRCGAQAQGVIPVADLVLDKSAKRGIFHPIERRTASRDGRVGERSRQSGRKMEFFFAGVGVACAAFLLADMVFGTVSTPLAQVEAALGRS